MMPTLPTDTLLGRLVVVELLSATGPFPVFVVSNAAGHLYLALWQQKWMSGERFLLVGVTEAKVRLVKAGVVSVEQAFASPADPQVIAVEPHGGSAHLVRLTPGALEATPTTASFRPPTFAPFPPTPVPLPAPRPAAPPPPPVAPAVPAPHPLLRLLGAALTYVEGLAERAEAQAKNASHLDASIVLRREAQAHRAFNLGLTKEIDGSWIEDDRAGQAPKIR